MSEPGPAYKTAVQPEVNPDAITIAAEIVRLQPETVTTWIRAALAGTLPLRGTYGWDAWICYQTAVRALGVSRRP